MYWMDTPQAYGRVTRALHWIMAALILWQFLGMGLRLGFGRQPFVSTFVGSHQPVGLILLGLILARMIWAFAMRRRRPAHLRLAWAARLGHGALYALMLVVPLLALIRAWGGARAFAPFGFQIFPARDPAVEWAVTLGDMLHGELAWVLAVLIAGHVAMVILHERVWRDGTLARMTGRAAR
ncbi:MAG: cytochrome b [Paracoccus sp. (in: a-proteobacteria)]|nr:cytochrome b [Paracoccus sp. (in: a-proteobacteria)]